jgi:glutaredoxin 3
MPRLTIYSTGRCPICDKSKTLLDKWMIPYQEVRLDLDSGAVREFARLTNGARTVPQFAIDGRWIGGFTELTELHMDNELDELMEPSTD